MSVSVSIQNRKWYRVGFEPTTLAYRANALPTELSVPRYDDLAQLCTTRSAHKAHKVACNRLQLANSDFTMIPLSIQLELSW